MYNFLIGKTIKSVTKMKMINNDDEGFLLIKFTDNTNCLIMGGYDSYTGNSSDEYQTIIDISMCNEKGEYFDDSDTSPFTINGHLTPIINSKKT